nr:MAG TPA: hypothetical protein [Inoviridae sp.]
MRTGTAREICKRCVYFIKNAHADLHCKRITCINKILNRATIICTASLQFDQI